MARWIATFLTVFTIGFAPPALAQADDIRSTITNQVDAFLNDDVEQAFTYASPTIKRLFGNATNFGRMVREGYPMVWRPAEMTFGGLKVLDGKNIQTVFFTDSGGRVFEAAYEMVETANGWQINGVFIREADLGA